MSQSIHVETMTLTIDLSNGDLHKLVVELPKPSGDNPRMLAQQITAGIHELAGRADQLTDSYGAQIRDARMLGS